MTSKNATAAKKKSLREAFTLAKEVVDHWDQFPDHFIAIPVTSPLASALFTPERRRLLAELKSHGTHQSVNALAACLGRDATRVGRDIKPLIDAGLVRATPFGKSKKLSATNRPVIIQ
ncbi:MAG: hypothetical protein ABR586_09100 [Thermoplasmatota archaeon]